MSEERKPIALGDSIPGVADVQAERSPAGPRVVAYLWPAYAGADRISLTPEEAIRLSEALARHAMHAATAAGGEG